MSAHTKGKLSVLTAERGFILTAKDGIYDVAVVRNIGNEDNAANAARLALCWNTHDQLLEALEDCVEALDFLQDRMAAKVNPPTLDAARAAIKAAKGEA